MRVPGNTLLRLLMNWVNRCRIDADLRDLPDAEVDAVVDAFEASPAMLSATWSVEASSLKTMATYVIGPCPAVPGIFHRRPSRS